MILIVDDEKEIAENILENLKLSDLDAFSTSSPEEAVEMIKKNRYKCVITDIAMPKINGIQLASALRKSRPEIKIIAVSGYAEIMVPDLEEIKVDFFLQKPFCPDELVTCVKKCLDKSATSAF